MQRLTLFCFILLNTAARAQSGLRDTALNFIRGSIVTESSSTAENATVMLCRLPGMSVSKYTLADRQGNFAFPRPLNGQYTIKVSLSGFSEARFPAFEIKPDMTGYDAGTIKLKDSAAALQGVTIKSVKPAVELKQDGAIAMNVTSDMARASNAFDLLSKAPGVFVKPNDDISLMGKNNPLIYVNNKPLNLDRTATTVFLKSLQAKDVKAIEVLPVTSARYDGTTGGGIINIVLDRMYGKGIKATLLGQYGQGVYHKANGSLSLSYNTKRISTYLTAAADDRSNFQEDALTRNFLRGTAADRFEMDNFTKLSLGSYSLRAGADYTINKKSTLGLMLFANRYRERLPQYNRSAVFTNDTVSDSSYTTSNTSNNRRTDFSANINYRLLTDKKGGAITADIDYSRFDISMRSAYDTRFAGSGGVPGDSVILNSTAPVVAEIKSIKADWTKNAGKKVKLEAGVKYSSVSNSSDLNFNILKSGIFVPDTLRSNDFRLEENILAGYISATHTLPKLQLQAGLRAEHTVTDGKTADGTAVTARNYINLLPSFLATCTFKPQKSVLSFAANRRIRRPFYSDLNPFLYFVDPFTQIQGNPLLLPQLTTSVELTYVLNNKYYFTASGSFTRNGIFQTPFQNDSLRSTTLITTNLDRGSQAGISLRIPASISKWWSASTNVSAYRRELRTGTGSNRFSIAQLSAEVSLVNSIKLPRKYLLEITGLYISPVVQGIFSTKSLYTLSANVRKPFFRDRLSAKLSVDDIFRSYYVRSSTRFQNQNTIINQRIDSRIIWLSISCNFLRGNDFNAQRRRAGNLDEKQRIK